MTVEAINADVDGPDDGKNSTPTSVPADLTKYFSNIYVELYPCKLSASRITPLTHIDL